jgi:hypothetical protein
VRERGKAREGVRERARKIEREKARVGEKEKERKGERRREREREIGHITTISDRSFCLGWSIWHLNRPSLIQ